MKNILDTRTCQLFSGPSLPIPGQDVNVRVAEQLVDHLGVVHQPTQPHQYCFA